MKRIGVTFGCIGIWVVVSSLTLAAQTIPKSDFRVKLLGPLSTKTSQKGDKITAQVLSPQDFKGDIMEGKVTEVKSSGKMKGQAVLNFTFETLHHGGQNIAVRSSVKSVTNSKGQQDVDEEGRVVKKTNNIGKAALGTGLGALIGGIAGGARGAAIGAGVGAAASIVMIQMTVKGNAVDFAPGTEFLLSVKEARKSGS
jgi:hypothetical protein